MGQLYNHSQLALHIAELCIDAGIKLPFTPYEARIYSNKRLSWYDRAGGTWRWHFWYKDMPVFIGSNVKASEFKKAKSVSFIAEEFGISGIEIFPVY